MARAGIASRPFGCKSILARFLARVPSKGSGPIAPTPISTSTLRKKPCNEKSGQGPPSAASARDSQQGKRPRSLRLRFPPPPCAKNRAMRNRVRDRPRLPQHEIPSKGSGPDRSDSDFHLHLAQKTVQREIGSGPLPAHLACLSTSSRAEAGRVRARNRARFTERMDG